MSEGDQRHTMPQSVWVALLSALGLIGLMLIVGVVRTVWLVAKMGDTDLEQERRIASARSDADDYDDEALVADMGASLGELGNRAPKARRPAIARGPEPVEVATPIPRAPAETEEPAPVEREEPVIEAAELARPQLRTVPRGPMRLVGGEESDAQPLVDEDNSQAQPSEIEAESNEIEPESMGQGGAVQN